MKAAGEPLHCVRDADRDPTVMIVDDSEVFRGALRDLIAATPGFLLVAESCSGEEALETIELARPQLVLIDIRMPGIGGLAAARAILKLHPRPVVMLISADDPDLQPGVEDLGEAVARVRKQDLRPRELSRLWEIYAITATHRD
jgi:DNA-binding NarL/FixJ family response regulator